MKGTSDSHIIKVYAPGAGCSTAWRGALCRLLAALMIAVALTARLSAPAHADIPVEVKASEQQGFARIVLTFERLPAYEHRLESSIFVLAVEEPVQADLGEIATDLPTYIGMARRDPDGRALRIALNRSFRVNLMEAGDQLFIDILPPTWQGLPPGLPTHVIKELSRLAAQSERKAVEEARQRAEAESSFALEVRSAHHPTFTRIVFDWNKFVTASIAREGRRVSVKFGRRADVDLSRLRADPPKFLHAVDLDKYIDGMQVRLTLDDDVDVRGFREGNAYVVDLTSPDVAADASAATVVQQPPGKATPGDGADAKGPPAEPGTRVDKADTDAVPETAKEITDLAAVGQAEDDFADDAPEADGPAVVAAAAEDAATPPPAPTPAPAKTVPAAPAASQEPDPQQPSVPAPSRRPAVAQSAEAAPQQGPPPARAEAQQPRPETRPGDATHTVAVSVEDAGGNLRLTFPFDEAVSAAAFRRTNTIWLVFDSDRKLDLDALKQAVGPKIARVQNVRSQSMQYVRLELSRAWLTYVSSDDTAWRVDIGDMVGGEAEPLRLQRKLRSDNRSVIGIALDKPGRVHWLADPQIGDRIAVVTAFGPQRGIAKPQDFVEFRLLATAHGIAVQPLSDDVAVRLLLEEVVITRAQGLTLSAGGVHQYVPGRKPLKKTARPGFIDAARLKVSKPSRLSNRIHELQRLIAMSAEEAKNTARFSLAQLYFANGFTLESLGLLHRMAQTDPGVANDPSFNMLRGAALTLLGRTAAARKDFQVHALAHDADTALWKGLLDVVDRNWESALGHFKHGADTIGRYPADLQARFHLAAARSALELKRLARAAEELDALPKNGTADPELAMGRHLLHGWYLESTGRVDEALESYDKVLKSKHRPAVAEAELRTVGLLLAQERLTRPEAVKQLERLQLVWRGDETEQHVMRLLARLYVEEGNYRGAFEMMKNAVLMYPESRLALLLQDDMKQVFKKLFLGDGQDRLKPIESLALYYQFRELTPVGRKGDEMIRRLADRLIGFDLLDQAAELLDHQVNKRLKGAARSQVATRLAMVQLMNHKPELALRVIRHTRQAGLPATLRRSRNLLEARALGELGRAEAAIEILNAMKGADVERLKADALWTAQKWSDAGEQLERMLGPRWQQGGALSKAERFNILRAGVAYSLAGDQFALDRIHKKFYEKMRKTQDAEAFAVVTKPVKSQGVTFRDLAKDIAAIDTLDAFMREYRARYDRSGPQAQTSATPAEPGRS